MIRLSAPFLATKRNQLEFLSKVDIFCVEAVIFNQSDLIGDSWENTWANVELACKMYGGDNVVFHFPVNDSDYVKYDWIHSKLKEAYSRSSDLGVSGIVVHSNRVRPISMWHNLDLFEERCKVIDALIKIISIPKIYKPWIGLENMPLMDNKGIEIDPLFCFPEDFLLVTGTGLGITWDLCHYSSTLENVKAVISGKQRGTHYPNIRNAQLIDFQQLEKLIVHWHFSSFYGVANPDDSTECIEGVLPKLSTLGECFYITCLNYMKQILMPEHKVTLEIQDENYLSRPNLKKMIEWIKYATLKQS